MATTITRLGRIVVTRLYGGGGVAHVSVGQTLSSLANSIARLDNRYGSNADVYRLAWSMRERGERIQFANEFVVIEFIPDN